MFPLNEAPFDPTVAVQLHWIKVLEICAGGLLVLALLMVVIGLLGHASWRGHLWAILPLAAGLLAVLILHHVHDTYLAWENLLGSPTNWSFPPDIAKRLLAEIARDNQAAATFGWVVVSITGVVLIVSLLRIWRLVQPGKRSQQSASLALKS